MEDCILLKVPSTHTCAHIYIRTHTSMHIYVYICVCAHTHMLLPLSNMFILHLMKAVYKYSHSALKVQI